MKRRKTKRQLTPWSDDERAALDALLPCLDVSIPEIAAQLGRSEYSVKAYMSRNKLRRSGPVRSRRCLTCGRIFTVRYRFNFVCPRCKKDPGWHTLADPETP